MSTCAHPSAEERLAVLDDQRSPDAFARAIARGFGTQPRAIDESWLYDEAGVALLEELRRQPEHYVVSAERQILADRADALPLYFPDGRPTVIEYGVVDVERTSALLAPLLAAHETLEYVAVGPHLAAVEPACRALLERHCGLQASASIGRFEDAGLRARHTSGPVLVFWPGGGLGAYERAEAIAALRGIGSVLSGRDLLVAGVDLRKDPRSVERCHSDRAGHARRLRLNLIVRLASELGAAIVPALFRDRVVYDPETGRVDAYVVSRRSQSVRLGSAGLTVDFGKGEQVHVGAATKFSPQEIDQSARAAELTVHERWYGREGRMCVNLLRPIPKRR